MQFADLKSQRKNNTAWRLLASPHAPFIVSFLYQVFIQPNERSLAFDVAVSKLDSSLVIFALKIPWLKSKEIFYWGDIDTHGFSILSRLRHFFPRANSIMMDENTLGIHQALCVTEPDKSRCQNQLQHLKKAEQQLYQQLQKNHQRLEQERLPMNYVNARLKHC